MFNRFFNRLTIKNKLRLGFGVLIMLAVLLGVLLLQTAHIEEQMFNRLRETDQLTFTVQQMKVEVLELRRHEKNFLLRYNSQSFEGAYGNYVLPNQQHTKNLLNLIEQVRQQIERANQTEQELHNLSFVNKQEEAVLKYQAVFKGLVENIRQRGNQSRGHVGEVFTQIEALTAELTDTNQPELLILNATLREAFLSYLHFGLQSSGYSFQESTVGDHAQFFNHSLQRFDEQIAQSGQLPPATQPHLTLHLETIQAAFAQLIALDNQIAEQETDLSINARAVSTLAERIISNEQTMQQESLARFQETIKFIQAFNLLLLFITISISIGLAFIFTRNITNPITQLTEVTAQVAKGDLEQRVKVESHDEIGILAGTFNSMTHQLQQTMEGLEQRVLERTQHLNELNQQLQHELMLAHRIQQGLLPQPHPNWPHFDVVCFTAAAQEIGGDFYNYHTFDDHHAMVAVGDVSGKGVAAALLMATSLSQFDASLTQSFSPAERLSFLDQKLMPYTSAAHRNCAMSYVELKRVEMSTPPQFQLHSINAGCIPPYIKRKTGQVEFYEIGGFALGQGLGEKLGYQMHTVDLWPGDMIILTSDGVVEANNTANQMLGFDRLLEIVETGPTNSAAAMLDHLQQAVWKFTGPAEQHDDMTIVVIQVKT